MKLDNIDIIKLLPQFMRDDKFIQALSKVLNDYFKEQYHIAVKQAVWNHLDEMTHEELDMLAWELNIDWYSSNASKKEKINTIKNSTFIFEHRGTKGAVEYTLRSLFGECMVREWFEYDGRPYTFKVETAERVAEDSLSTIYRAIGIAQNERSLCEGLIIDQITDYVKSYGVQVSSVIENHLEVNN